jgi:RNA polymerase sigma-70 factor (ECF subfamily)
MQTFTDEQLIEVIKGTNGNRRKKAFDYLYLRYHKPITNYFYFALQKDHEKAKDFFHDLFLKLIETPEKFDTNRQFKPWIFRIAENMCHNDYRRTEVENKYHEYVLHSVHNHTQLTDIELSLAKCIKKLHREQRSLIILRFKINLSIKEIAEIFECPEGTIKSRLFYATKELSKLYRE